MNLTPFDLEFLRYLATGRAICTRSAPRTSPQHWKATMMVRGQGLLPGGEKAGRGSGVVVFEKELVKKLDEADLIERIRGKRFDSWRLTDAGREAAS